MESNWKLVFKTLFKPRLMGLYGIRLVKNMLPPIQKHSLHFWCYDADKPCEILIFNFQTTLLCLPLKITAELKYKLILYYISQSLTYRKA